MQNVCNPSFDDGNTITGRASAGVTGKRFVAISGNSTDGVPAVAHATAAGRVFGVAGYDAASGAILPVVRKGVVPVLAAAAIAAFEEVEVGANGRAVPKASGVAVGYAMFDAADATDAQIVLYE